MNYSRSNPSPRYRELIALYGKMHAEEEDSLGAPGKTFDGKSLPPQATRIRDLIRRTGAMSILDYGSGKGRQYAARRVEIPGEGVHDSIQDYWGVDYIYCYDPAYPPYSRLPEGRFHGVIATDVLEHCPDDDLHWIVSEMFSFSSRFVFASVAGYKARKTLPNGENTHCTIRPADWWRELFKDIASRHRGVEWEVFHLARVDTGAALRFVETRLGAAVEHT